MIKVIELSSDIQALVFFSAMFAVCWLIGYPITIHLIKKLGDKKKAVMIGLIAGGIPMMITFGILRDWSIWLTILGVIVGIAYIYLYSWIIFYYRAKIEKKD